MSRYLKTGFNHVSIMEKVPLGFVVHDPNKSSLDTYILPEAPTEQFIKSFLQRRPDYTILEVAKEASNKEFNQVKLGLQSCVSICAYILAIRMPWWRVTPYDLYRKLLEGDIGIISVRRLR